MTRNCLLIFGALLAIATLGLRAGAVGPPPAEESSLDQEIAQLQRSIAAKRDEADALSAKLQALLKQRREERAAAKPPAIEPDERLTISSIVPNEGAAGAMLRLHGKGFTGTKKVTFIVQSLAEKDAVFKVISDEELSVIAPEYLEAGLEAAVLVHSDAGVTVSTPNADTVIVTEPGQQKDGYARAIRKGGISESGGMISLVEDSGILASPAVITLIKKGGRLAASPARSTVYYEPGGLFEGDVKKHENQLEVPRVTLSPVKSLYTFTMPKHAEGESKSPPRIASVTPDHGKPGDIIVLRGAGFLGTESVAFFPGQGDQGKAGFEVVSDEVLRLQVAASRKWYRSGDIIVVQTPKGLTLAIGKDTPKIEGDADARHRVKWITKGGVFRGGGGGAMYLVDEGGILMRSGGGGCTYFVKEGGSLLGTGGGGATIFHEPKAVFGEGSIDDRSRAIEVPSIGVSLVEKYFNSPEKD